MITHLREEASRPERVVVLGAKGFVAAALARHLAAQDVPVVALGSDELDLRQSEAVGALREVLRADDSLVFVSALTPDKGRDIATLMANLTMAQHVAAALEAASPAHVVYVSSDAVYSDDANPVRETSCPDPSTLHGVMHVTREKMLVHASRPGKTPLLLLRPSAVYGPGDTHNSYGPNRFARLAARGEKIALFGQGEEQRDHLFVDDLSRLIGLCLARRSAGILNAASGAAVSFMDVAQMAVELASGAIEPTPRANPITHRHFDAAALLRAFPTFVPTPLDQGLGVTVDAARRENGGE